MVACHRRHATRAINGHVYTSEEYNSLRRPQCAQVLHVDSETSAEDPIHIKFTDMLNTVLQRGPLCLYTRDVQYNLPC